MFNPNKRLGDESDDGEKKPGMTVAVLVGKPKKPSGFNPSKRLGDEPEYDEEQEEDRNPEQSMSDAVAGICKCLNVSSSVAPRLQKYLQAFFYAADSLPHDEGENPDREEN